MRLCATVHCSSGWPPFSLQCILGIKTSFMMVHSDRYSGQQEMRRHRTKMWSEPIMLQRRGRLPHHPSNPFKHIAIIILNEKPLSQYSPECWILLCIKEQYSFWCVCLLCLSLDLTEMINQASIKTGTKELRCSVGFQQEKNILCTETSSCNTKEPRVNEHSLRTVWLRTKTQWCIKAFY